MEEFSKKGSLFFNPENCLKSAKDLPSSNLDLKTFCNALVVTIELRAVNLKLGRVGIFAQPESFKNQVGSIKFLNLQIPISLKNCSLDHLNSSKSDLNKFKMSKGDSLLGEGVVRERKIFEVNLGILR